MLFSEITRVKIEKEGFHTYESTIKISDQEHGKYIFQLMSNAPTKFDIKVIVRRVGVVEGAKVTLEVIKGPNGQELEPWCAEGVSDADGKLLLTADYQIPRGTLMRVTAQKDNHLAFEKEFYPNSSEVATVEIEMEDMLFDIMGIVKLNGKRVSGALGEIYKIENNEEVKVGDLLTGSGEFEFFGYSPGTYKIVFLYTDETGEYSAIVDNLIIEETDYKNLEIELEKITL